MEQIQQMEDNANKGNVDACVYLSYCYYKGSNGVEKKDFEKSAKLCQKALEIDPNNTHSLNLLGYYYEKGLGVKKDYVEAFRCYYKSSKLVDDPQHTYGILSLGNIYEQRIKDWKEAARLYLYAAEQGEVFGYFYLGYLYERGGGGQSEKDEINYMMIELEIDPVIGEDKIKRPKRKALDNSGKVEQNLALAFKYYEMFDQKVENKDIEPFFDAAEKEDLPDEQITLGLMYLKGIGVKQDHSKAYKYLKMASKNNEEGRALFENFVNPDYQHRVLFGHKALSKEEIEQYEK